MVVAVALIAILTASITSVFVEAAQRRQRAGSETQESDSVETLQRLDEVPARLAAIEATLSGLEPSHGKSAAPEHRPQQRLDD
jgi:type II secretory pathway component PulJ